MMAIRFACASCGKVHRIPDEHAGKPGKCGRCGNRFVAPGVVHPASSSVFVPAASPDLWADRPARSWGAVQAVLLGLGIAVILVIGVFLLRDRLATAHPALVPMLPPPAAPAVPAAPRGQVPPAIGDDGGAVIGVTTAVVVSFAMLLALFIVVVVLPILVPMILSRKGYLSTGRWLIMAGASGLVAVLFGALVVILFFPMGLILAFVSPFAWATLGCLVAAAVNPRAHNRVVVRVRH